MGLRETGWPRREWQMRHRFANFRVEDLNNGLTLDENRRLACTPHTDEFVIMILRGLHRLAGTAK
jgi:hypothetical protein